MRVNKKTLEHVANLARLNFTDKEKEKLMLDMENIISYIDKLNELDTSEIIPTDHVIPIKNIFRDDEVLDSYPKDKMLMNAPSKEDGCFKVPKVVE
ncbi:Asp-tRNA(Asn)/Glu-tRNA(Gln) amidotransferase subunit GatC [Acetivibrio mesophilus]|uniref:Aspartyl/glutamyl-tRNA(Asn/Gln) amidotransferase subunit C n=1 Tax=Acetivibrio mesophilus TaxID=2487273 RepID=A0A4Q0I7K8_9FIRM|nr:Asp-tRNA(Asn)/Glu-tRNA(Gln) amidotransferase subunit GatC [Acetivibrio mesophilus]ODM25129.1 asparaginyl/glutamyl-tRNA amidotransferase subunit C [Clostridium sp. Bc-iso-3]RXE59855.1 Asp-tRNA(Asn)/Glu-tRNA(Gln) amidotransferase subunit GatC [Acetivibrio mesophilus]HHV29643.1 Asp-tRNA(Asn)/Glu-tRNA(Gln) amidotransferase subunit GatC [Clostridium sp.]